MGMTCNWAPRMLATGVVAGHFMLAIRKNPEQDIWSLAVEWNGNCRVLAACGEDEPLRQFLDACLRLRMDTVSQSPNYVVRKRTEQALNDEDDCLFAAGAG